MSNPKNSHNDAGTTKYMSLTTVEWYPCSPLPVFVRFHYIPPAGEHPLTLQNVRERYSREIRGAALVVWREVDSGRFGFRAGIDEFAGRIDDLGGFEFGFTRPAKGAGNIWLSTNKDTILSTDRFSDDLLNWFRTVVAILGQMFPGMIVENDCGCDA